MAGQLAASGMTRGARARRLLLPPVNAALAKSVWALDGVKRKLRRWSGRPPAAVNDPLALSCHAFRYLYHHLPKTGSTTLGKYTLLLDGYPVSMQPRPGQPGPHTPFVNLIAKYQVPASQSGLIWYRGYRRFTFVRNPYDRLLSLWASNLRDSPPRYAQYRKDLAKYYPGMDFSGIPFADFVRFVCGLEDADSEKHFVSQSALLGKWRMDFVGRFETYAVSCAELVRAFGLPGDSLALLGVRNNPGAHRRYTEYYDDALRRLMERRYARDLERWNYRFGD